MRSCSREVLVLGGYLCLSNLCQKFTVYKPSDIASNILSFNKQEVVAAW